MVLSNKAVKNKTRFGWRSTPAPAQVLDPGSGPPCGSLFQAFKPESVRADHRSWHSCVNVIRVSGGRAALPAIHCDS